MGVRGQEALKGFLAWSTALHHPEMSRTSSHAQATRPAKTPWGLRGPEPLLMPWVPPGALVLEEAFLTSICLLVFKNQLYS